MQIPEVAAQGIQMAGAIAILGAYVLLQLEIFRARSIMYLRVRSQRQLVQRSAPRKWIRSGSASTLISTLMESHDASHSAHSESGVSGWLVWFGFPRIRYAVPAPISGPDSERGSGLFLVRGIRRTLVRTLSGLESSWSIRRAASSCIVGMTCEQRSRVMATLV